MDILKTKQLPAALTSYDLLKTLALILMVIDHVGYFFFPDDMWWRILGRLSVPIWFFLIGYASTREVPKLFWILGAAVAASALVAGEYLFPLNIVFMLIIARLSVDWMFTHALRNREAFAGMFFLLFLMGIPSLAFIEYGTIGLLFTLMGTLKRREDDVKAPRWMLWAFISASVFVYILIQGLLMPSISGAQLLVFLSGMIVLMIVLNRFRPHVFEKLNTKTMPPIALLQLTGRRTLEIYALHIIILRALAMMHDPERFSFLEFDVFAFKQIHAFIFG